MLFHYIVGNPPYQKPAKTNKKGGSPSTIWPKFVKQSLEYLNDGGYLAYIHPGFWRKPDSELWSLLTKWQIEWLEMHAAIKRGPKTSEIREPGEIAFGAGVKTPFDCYTLHKVPYAKKTLVNDFTGKDNEIDLREWPWLPGGEFDIINKLFVKDREDKLEIIHSTDYGTGHKYMSDNKCLNHKYPCINSIHENGEILYRWSSRNDKGHFGIPKVVFTDGGNIHAIPDYTGEYGLTWHAIGIPINCEKEMNLIIQALNSNAFKKVVWATKWSSFQVDARMFTHFKKDFYKIILEEEKKNAK